MHDHPRLAGARPGEHEVVALERRGDDGLLLGVGERGEDAAVRRLGGRHLEHVLAPGEVAAHEVGANLQGANFTRAQLVNADLTGANLDQAIFLNAQMDGCK